MFDDFVVPVGVDKSLVIDTILLELAEISLIYSDPGTFKFMVGKWSTKELPVWQRMVDAMNLKYDPIGNYWRKETDKKLETRNLKSTDYETRDLASTTNQTRDLQSSNLETRDLRNTNLQTRDLAGTEDETRNLKGTNHETRNLKDSSNSQGSDNNLQTHTGTDTTTHGVWAFNSLEMQPSTEDATTYGHGINDDRHTENTGTVDYTGTDNWDSSDTGTINRDKTDTGTVDDSGTDSGTVKNDGTDTGTVEVRGTDSGTDNRDKTDTGTVNRDRTIDAVGNTGIRSVQELIQQELELSKFNIVDYIVEQFKLNFCLLVW